MSALIRRSAGSLIRSNCVCNNYNQIATTSKGSSLLSWQASKRTLFTSPVLQFKTKKRRKRYPYFWLQDKYKNHYDDKLTQENEDFFQQFLKDRYNLKDDASPLKTEPWKIDTEYQEGFRRTGLLARKLGSFPMWTKDGKRLLTTLLMVSDNHVVKYHSPEEFQKNARPVDASRYKGRACIVVGADSTDPRQFTAEYNGLFNESGVMPKKKLTRFLVSPEAKIEPGTPLLASHFRPGMYVDVAGKTIEWGRKGVRFRYKLKLGNATHGTTKAHNRIGSIGRGRKWCGPLKGMKMPGHEGGERIIMAGLRVWRVNTKYNLIYVHGPAVPGENGKYVNVMDSLIPSNRLTAESNPPFPTASVEENSKLDEELYHDDLHKPSEPSIIFEITEEEKKQRALAMRLGKAKTAQKIR